MDRTVRQALRGALTAAGCFIISCHIGVAIAQNSIGHIVTQKEMMPHYVHSKDYEKGFCDAWAWRSQQELGRESRKSESFVYYIYPQLGEGNASGRLWVDCQRYKQQ